MNNVKYTPIIGLEIHVALKTASKMFCGCKNDPFHAAKPNIYTCPVCLGLPGALPVPNRKAVEWTIMLGLALNCEIPFHSKFDRKNYFYPDLPKGFQITQYDQPLCLNGKLEINVPVILASEGMYQTVRPKARPGSATETDSGQARMTRKKIRIHRVHLEEDTGKLQHTKVNGKKVTLIDFNRSGVPLVEIVTEPDINSSEEAKIFLKKLHQIIRYINISDADMEKGSMRLEPNISVKRKALSVKEVDNLLPSYKVEVKNINSFNFVKRAIDYEVERQVKILDRGEVPVQETRGWDEKKNVTLPQRRKEAAHDYRYFPEPDIPPMQWQQSTINNLQLKIPELPEAKFARFTKVFGLPDQSVERLVEARELADYFENSVKGIALSVKFKDITPKMIANWLINKPVDIQKTSPADLLEQIQKTKAVTQFDEKELEAVIKKVLADNPRAVSDYKTGKTNVLMYLIGMTMQELKRKTYVSQLKTLIIKFLNNTNNIK